MKSCNPHVSRARSISRMKLLHPEWEIEPVPLGMWQLLSTLSNAIQLSRQQRGNNQGRGGREWGRGGFTWVTICICLSKNWSETFIGIPLFLLKLLGNFSGLELVKPWFCFLLLWLQTIYYLNWFVGIDGYKPLGLAEALNTWLAFSIWLMERYFKRYEFPKAASVLLVHFPAWKWM